MQNFRTQVADLIDRFLNGEVNAYEWDDFIGKRAEDSLIEEIRLECMSVPTRFPPGNSHAYCSQDGFNYLKELSNELKLG